MEQNLNSNPLPSAAAVKPVTPKPRPKSKLIAFISPDLCSGCEACISVMPGGVCIEKTAADATTPTAMVVVDVNTDVCTGCTMCQRICPWEAISMVPRPQEPAA